MKNIWIVVVIVLVLALGYLGRHQLKAMLGGSSTPAPTTSSYNTPTQASPSTASDSGAIPSNSIVMTKSGTNGTYFTDSKGMSLYTFDKDTKNTSNCTGNCLTIWPPFKVDTTTTLGIPTGFDTLTTAAGTKQYSYKGMPLYYYAKDTKAGDTLGDGVGGVWHLAKP